MVFFLGAFFGGIAGCRVCWLCVCYPQICPITKPCAWVVTCAHKLGCGVLPPGCRCCPTKRDANESLLLPGVDLGFGFVFGSRPSSAAGAPLQEGNRTENESDEQKGRQRSVPQPRPPAPLKRRLPGGAGLRTGAAAQYSLKTPVPPLPALDRI